MGRQRRVGASISERSEAAYLSDIRDIDLWSALHGQPTAVNLSEGQLFAYFVDLVRRGRSASTIRRRLTAIRWHLENSPTGAVPENALRELEKRVLRGVAGQTGILVISEDAVIRAGLTAVLAESGVLCWSVDAGSTDIIALGCWDYVIVWIQSPNGLDQFGAINTIRALGAEIAAQVPIIVVHPAAVSPIVQLRLAEAGARYLVPQSWLSENIHELSSRLETADVPLRFHLETPFALRHKLGFRLIGNLGALLDEAALVGPTVWTHNLPQDRLPISRSQITRLRRAGLELAGIPVPDETRYSTAFRDAPALTDWASIRRVVREAWGLNRLL